MRFPGSKLSLPGLSKAHASKILFVSMVLTRNWAHISLVDCPQERPSLRLPVLIAAAMGDPRSLFFGASSGACAPATSAAAFPAGPAVLSLQRAP